MTLEEFNELVDNATVDRIRESRLKPIADVTKGMLDDADLTFRVQGSSITYGDNDGGSGA